jgi:regulatory protein
MPEITKIEAQKRRKDRYNIYLDGKFAFPVSIDSIAYFSLEKGKILNESDLQKILDDDVYQKILDKTLNFISYKIRSEKEIYDRLDTYLYKSVKPEKLREDIRKKVLEKVKKLDLIDDKGYAGTYINIKKSAKNPPGKQKVIEFLYKKGISGEIINECVEVYDFEVEKKGAMKFAKRKIKSYKSDTFKNRNKLWKYLAGKGYSPDVIRSVVDSVYKV